MPKDRCSHLKPVRKTMMNTSSLALHPSRSVLDRLLSFLDRSAEIAVRNGDLAYFGL